MQGPSGTLRPGVAPQLRPPPPPAPAAPTLPDAPPLPGPCVLWYLYGVNRVLAASLIALAAGGAFTIWLFSGGPPCAAPPRSRTRSPPRAGAPDRERTGPHDGDPGPPGARGGRVRGAPRRPRGLRAVRRARLRPPGADGTYRFTDVPVGPLEVLAETPGRKAARATVTLVPGVAAEMILELPAPEPGGGRRPASRRGRGWRPRGGCQKAAGAKGGAPPPPPAEGEPPVGMEDGAPGRREVALRSVAPASIPGPEATPPGAQKNRCGADPSREEQRPGLFSSRSRLMGTRLGLWIGGVGLSGLLAACGSGGTSATTDFGGSMGSGGAGFTFTSRAWSSRPTSMPDGSPTSSRSPGRRDAPRRVAQRRCGPLPRSARGVARAARVRRRAPRTAWRRTTRSSGGGARDPRGERRALDPAYAVLHVGEPVRDTAAAPVVEPVRAGPRFRAQPRPRARPRPRGPGLPGHGRVRRPTGAGPLRVPGGDPRRGPRRAPPRRDRGPRDPQRPRERAGHVRGGRGRGAGHRGDPAEPRGGRRPRGAARPRPRHPARRGRGRLRGASPVRAMGLSHAVAVRDARGRPQRPGHRDGQRPHERAVPRRGGHAPDPRGPRARSRRRERRVARAHRGRRPVLGGRARARLVRRGGSRPLRAGRGVADGRRAEGRRTAT